MEQKNILQIVFISYNTKISSALLMEVTSQLGKAITRVC